MYINTYLTKTMQDFDLVLHFLSLLGLHGYTYTDFANTRVWEITIKHYWVGTFIHLFTCDPDCKLRLSTVGRNTCLQIKHRSCSWLVNCRSQQSDQICAISFKPLWNIPTVLDYLQKSMVKQAQRIWFEYLRCPQVENTVVGGRVAVMLCDFDSQTYSTVTLKILSSLSLLPDSFNPSGKVPSNTIKMLLCIFV